MTRLSPPLVREAGYSLVELLGLDGHHGHRYRCDLLADEPGAGQRAGAARSRRHAAADARRERDAVQGSHDGRCGTLQGNVTGSLIKYFAPIVPRRVGHINPDPADGR